MTRALFVFFVTVTTGLGTSSSQVPGNVTARVVQLRYSGSTGTAFIMDFQESSYLVTAEHMVAGAGVSAKIDILGGGDHEWHTMDLLVMHGEIPCSDVAVLKLPTGVAKIVGIDALPAMEKHGIFLGQEAYFLGFPYGLINDFGSHKIAVAFVKHAYFSAFVGCNAINRGAKDDKQLVLLDGMNNAGFSGGPVVAPDLNEPGHPFRLVGVVSGYQPDPLQADVDGKRVTTNLLGNSGIVVVIPIDEVVKIIENDTHPVTQQKLVPSPKLLK